MKTGQSYCAYLLFGGRCLKNVTPVLLYDSPDRHFHAVLLHICYDMTIPLPDQKQQHKELLRPNLAIYPHD